MLDLSGGLWELDAPSRLCLVTRVLEALKLCGTSLRHSLANGYYLMGGASFCMHDAALLSRVNQSFWAYKSP